MGSLEKLASALGRNDEEPNVELAEDIVSREDHDAVAEIVECLQEGKKAVRHDCIKVLYETGERNPELIAGYVDVFLTLIDGKDNRLAWGGMTALDAITTVRPDRMFDSLPDIVQAMKNGSVITRDRGVNILIKLMASEQYAPEAFSHLIEVLHTGPVNQLPMYAENILPVITKSTKEAFAEALVLRLDDIDKESKRKRVEKVLKKVERL